MREEGRNVERGQAMLIALIIGFGLILIMAGAVLIVRTQLSLGTTSTNNETSRDIAESGIDQYLWQLNQDSKFFTDNLNNPLNTAACIPVYKAPSVILGYFVLDIVPPNTQFPYYAVQSTGWLASNNADPNNPAPPANSMNKTVLVADLHEKEFTDYVDFCNVSELPAGYAGAGNVEDWNTWHSVI
jgi:type II secretory pathway pseudopilin PulG